jgi:hypothetical protein
MNKLLTLIISIILITSCQAQVRLTSIEAASTKWDIPVGKRAIPGQTGKHFLVYMTLANLMDSVGISAGGATDLSYTGTSGTITLNSSTGTDVTTTAGTGISITRTGADMTINSTITQGLTSLVGETGTAQTGTAQTFDTGTDGTDFNIASASGVHVFHMPSASATKRGLVTTGVQTFAGAKTFSYLGGAPTLGNSLIVADVNGRLENLYGVTTGHVPKWNGTAFILQADAGITSLGSQTGATQTFSTGDTGTYPSWSSASNVHTYRLPGGTNGQVLKHDGTDWKADTDNNTFQTLSFSSPNLSISSGNSVALPVLPTGASSNTLAYIGGAWATSAFLKCNATTTIAPNTNKRVEINNDAGGGSGLTWPSSIHTDTKFLVNGRIQLNSTSSTACTTLMGQNGDMEVGDVTVGDGLQLSSGSLKTIESHFGQLMNSSTASQSATTSMAKVTFSSSASSGTTVSPNTGTDEILIGATGLYEVSFNCSSIGGAADRTISFQIYNGTTAIGNTLGAVTKPASAYTTYHYNEILSLSNGNSINVKMAYDNATGSGTDIYVVNPRLIIKRKT